MDTVIAMTNLTMKTMQYRLCLKSSVRYLIWASCLLAASTLNVAAKLGKM